MIEELYHELRPFHIKVSLVEPGFFRTKFDERPPAAPLAVYEPARQSVQQFVRNEVEQGPDPEQVAGRIVPACWWPSASGYHNEFLSRCVAGFSR
jgi:NAD(P)-dependent dehydrogenase (short-subunit alcohol dehydrogenase family)